MRGSNQLKKILQQNTEDKAIILRVTLLYYLIMAGSVLLFNKNRFVFAIFSVPDALLLYLLHILTLPVFENDNGIKKLVAVSPVTAPGIASLITDAVVISMLAKMAMLLSWKFVFLYLLIPVIAIYEYFYKPLVYLKKQL